VVESMELMETPACRMAKASAQETAVVVRTPMRIARESFDFQGHHENEAEEGQEGSGVTQVAEADEGLCVADDHAGVAKPMKAMKRPMPLATAA